MTRLYPFSEPLQPTSANTTSGTNHVKVTVTTTVYKPNPFKGLNRIVFATDEWGHRNLGRLHRPLMGWLCDWWERRNTPVPAARQESGSD